MHFCIGVYLESLPDCHTFSTSTFNLAQKPLSRQAPSDRFSTVETLMDIPDEIGVQ